MSTFLRLVEAPPALEALPRGIECPLCCHLSTHLAGGCGSCPMGRMCHSLTCSRCGYRFVPEVRWQARLERWSGWARRRLAPWL